MDTFVYGRLMRLPSNWMAQSFIWVIQTKTSFCQVKLMIKHRNGDRTTSKKCNATVRSTCLLQERKNVPESTEVYLQQFAKRASCLLSLNRFMSSSRYHQSKG